MRSGTRVRWDRLGRVAVLCVMAAIVYLYLSAGISFYSSWREAKSNSAQVATLQRQHLRLEAEHRKLLEPVTTIQEARELGMMRPGEQTYVIKGLPNN
jgi:cell division protein FtsB